MAFTASAEPTPDGRGVRPDHQPVPHDQGHLEHLQPERLSKHRDRLVAQPSGRADQRRDGFRPLPQGAPADRTRAGRCSPNTIHPPELREALAECRMHPQELLAPDDGAVLAQPRQDRPGERPAVFVAGSNDRRMREHSLGRDLAPRQPALGLFRGLLRCDRPFLPRLHEISPAAAGMGQRGRF